MRFEENNKQQDGVKTKLIILQELVSECCIPLITASCPWLKWQKKNKQKTKQKSYFSPIYSNVNIVEQITDTFKKKKAK